VRELTKRAFDLQKRYFSILTTTTTVTATTYYGLHIFLLRHLPPNHWLSLLGRKRKLVDNRLVRIANFYPYTHPLAGRGRGGRLSSKECHVYAAQNPKNVDFRLKLGAKKGKRRNLCSLKKALLLFPLSYMHISLPIRALLTFSSPLTQGEAEGEGEGQAQLVRRL